MKLIINCPYCGKPTPLYLSEDTYLCKHTKHLCKNCATVLKAHLEVTLDEEVKTCSK